MENKQTVKLVEFHEILTDEYNHTLTRDDAFTLYQAWMEDFDYSIDDLADNLWTISLNEVYDEIDMKYSVFELADVIRAHGATDIRDMHDFEVYEVYRKLHPNTFIYLADDKFICVD